ncbi:MAG: hypothetical protein ACR2O3_09870 [Rhizobiaceae bacterium]
MDRRSFLKSVGAAGLLPALPIPSFAIPVPTAATAVSAHTYQWAEMIVRAHNKCNTGMLQRLLQVDTATASALKGQLLENGIINARANAYGIHTAVKPLYEGAFVSTHETHSAATKVVEKIAGKLEEKLENEPKEDINIKALESETESSDESEEASFEAPGKIAAEPVAKA